LHKALFAECDDQKCDITEKKAARHFVAKQLFEKFIELK
jgi:hypothetical protein